MTARQTFPPRGLAALVAPGRSAGPLRCAFNLCNGTRTQREIAKAAGVNQGNLARTIARWFAAGIVLKLGEDRDARYLHVYPLADTGKEGTLEE